MPDNKLNIKILVCYNTINIDKLSFYYYFNIVFSVYDNQKESDEAYNNCINYFSECLYC